MYTYHEFAISAMLTYRKMSVAEGVIRVEQSFTKLDLQNITCFSDLHEICDANTILPYHEDCNDLGWIKFANAVIDAFDKKYQTSVSPSR